MSDSLTPLADPIALFVVPLGRTGLRYAVTGAYAAMAYGDPRLTNDIDIILEASAGDAHRVATAFTAVGNYVPPEDVLVEEFSRPEFGHFNVIQSVSGLKADVYLAGNDPLHDWALNNRRNVLVENAPVSFVPPEYVLLRKLEYLRDGSSEKHLGDIRGILARSSSKIDLELLESWIHQRGLESTWNRVRG